jgi:hypothetical protein
MLNRRQAISQSNLSSPRRRHHPTGKRCGKPPLSTFLTDPEGVITCWGVTAERALGYAEAEAVGKPSSVIFTPEDMTTTPSCHHGNRS